jgi:NADH-quinone oxidoreductase subunit N
LLGIAIQENMSAPVVIYYLMAYSVSAIAAFWVLTIVTKPGEEPVEAFNGLVKRNPLLAGTMTLALLSMAGIPPLSGFFAKYFILINVLLSSSVWTAVVAILASLIGVYYYFRIIIAMFFAPAETAEKIQIDWLSSAGLILLCLLIIGMGLYPEFIFSLIK